MRHTHLSCRATWMLLDGPPSWRQRGRPQPIDEAEDFPEQVPRHRHFSQLERNVTALSDNAAVESFFGLLKRERVNRVRYRTGDEARADLFDYIEVFYNRKRRHGYLGNISPADFEERSTGSF